MARFLIVGEHERCDLLAGALERQGHVASVVPSPERRSLEHVAIVCWLAPSSPERFLLGSIDSSMRGLVYQASEWDASVLAVAARNSIPAASVRSDLGDDEVWLAEALGAIAALVEGPRPSERPGAAKAWPLEAPDAPF